MSRDLRSDPGRRRHAGVTLIEVLVAVIVTVIGLLGMVGLQLRSYAIESESYQRAQAAILLEDMANRIRANGENAAAYVAEDLGAGEAEVCSATAAAAEYDLCQWSNLLRGAAESHDNSFVGAMTAARSCIRAAPEPDVYTITVVWQGSVPTAEPGSSCARAAFADQTTRRALSTIVRIADLGS